MLPVKLERRLPKSLTLVAIKPVPKRGSVGLRYELNPIISRGPDATAFRY